MTVYLYSIYALEYYWGWVGKAMRGEHVHHCNRNSSRPSVCPAGRMSYGDGFPGIKLGNDS